MFVFKDCYAGFVNLDHREDRRQHMHCQLLKAGITAERTRGILPHEISATERLAFDKMLKRTKGAAGCHLAQVSVMKKALAQGKSALVMEDDLVFCEDFQSRVRDIEFFINEHEPDFDVFWLGGTVHINPPEWHTGSNPDLQGIPVLGRDAERTCNDNIIRTYGAFCTYAYIVNIKSLEKVIGLLEQNVHRSMGIDWLFIYLQPQLRTFMYLPGCVKQMDNQSDIGNGITMFSGFEKLGPYWYQDRKEQFNPSTFNFGEANVRQQEAKTKTKQKPKENMLIDIRDLAKKYKIQSKGVLHIGAHIGQEAEVYDSVGMKKMIFVEGNPSIYNKLCENIQKYPGAVAYNALISDDDGKEVDFNISSNDGQSSSILQLGTHKEQHPEVHFVGKMGLKTVRVDTFFEGKDFSGIDFLNIDIQGMELPALKSMGELLLNFKYAYLEVNRAQVYEGCAEIEEVEAYLKKFGFVRVEESWVGNWGDAFYIKNYTEALPGTMEDSLIDINIKSSVPESWVQRPATKPANKEGMIIQVEETFLLIADNFERYFGERTKSEEIENRMYIPIQWTAYYTLHKRGRDTKALSHVQHVLDGLDPSKKYFTICEWPEGILNYFKGKDIIVFGSGDVNINYKIDVTKNHEETRGYILDKIKTA